ncbi:adenylate kinase family protein [Orientia chuto str. Dubai]|uniref:Adenylate kinase n=1 Tax=Orientia chuto str. Dubai TaxID=1359168 RepID=A0A0F3MHM1_9RICK|nr:nucleoside monophosphate kinase [Candidatus Orientia mediorientalis]KJV55263.1 adenylate kinase family protein [Orientia chuto str. Dubai]
MILIFIGPPGSGKGTQAFLLSDDFSIISVGKALRAVMESNTEKADIVKNFVKHGRLVPSDITNKIVLDALKDIGQDKNIILDGYPRDIFQAEFLQKNLSMDFKVLFFDIDNAIVLLRLSGRISCNNCGKIYNKLYCMPKIDRVCDICGSSDFQNRVDDEESIIKSRLESYEQETLPLLEFYKAQNKLVLIDANQPAEVILKNIKKISGIY